MRRLVAAAVVAVALVGAFALWRGRRATPASAPRAEHAAPARGAVGPAEPAGPNASRAAAAEPLPRSLRGTTPSGALEVDAQGHFQPTPGAILFFEYFLSAAHEESPERIEARIRAAIRARLTPPADSEAEAFLAQFLDYRLATAAAFADPALGDAGDLERRLQWLREQRRGHFGAALAETLFAEEEDALRVQLERRRILRDTTLAPAERERRLEALEARYPEAVREARAQALAPLRRAREEAALRAEGASEADVHALRVRRFGAAAASRMQALDAARADWEARLAAYRAARAELLDEVGLDAAARDRALEELRAAHFASAERERVRLLDRLNEQNDGRD